jgi:hypothetical protein
MNLSCCKIQLGPLLTFIHRKYSAVIVISCVKTNEEYRKLLLRTLIPSAFNDTKTILLDDSFYNYVTAPDTVDWRLNGSVNPVQNQVSHSLALYIILYSASVCNYS